MQSASQVLVIDDDAEMNRMVGAYAQLMGFDYLAALSGAAGLEMARRSLPAVVLLDVMLPDLDGFEICRRLRSDQRTAAMPVILLTAFHDDEAERRGREAGASDYITKPFDPDQLIDAIKRLAPTGGT